MTEMPTRRQVLTLSALLAPTLNGPAWAQDDKACALVFVHGKWGNTQYVGFFTRRLEPYCKVRVAEAPWSLRRGYDAPYSRALDDMAAEVKALRDQGYRRVLVGGHSFGANAAMAYMARVGDADGVVAVAPGHAPAAMYARGIGKDAVDKARQLVQAGQGSETLTMEDLNQGQRKSVRMSAEVLWSYFDPEGLGHMPASAAAFKKPVPLLWVVGTADPIYRGGEEFAFRRAPPHPASQYLVYSGGHGDIEQTAEPVLAWLKALP